MASPSPGEIAKRRTRRRRLLTGAAILAGFCVFAAVGWGVLELTSRNAFCGACHQMRGAYSSWIGSTHYNNSSGMHVACVECHLPSRDQLASHIAAKIGVGLRATAKHVLDRPYDGRMLRERLLEELPDERCTQCHEELFSADMDKSAHIAHTVVLFPREGYERNCVSCHPWVGHAREEAAGGAVSAEDSDSPTPLAEGEASEP